MYTKRIRFCGYNVSKNLPADDAMPAINTYKAHSKNDESEKFPLYVIARQKYPRNMPKEAINVVLYSIIINQNNLNC